MDPIKAGELLNRLSRAPRVEAPVILRQLQEVVPEHDLSYYIGFAEAEANKPNDDTLIDALLTSMAVIIGGKRNNANSSSK